MLKLFMSLTGLLAVIVVFTFIMYKITFYPLDSVNPKSINIEINPSLPVIDIENIYHIKKLPSLPENSKVVVFAKIKKIQKKGEFYEGIINDNSGDYRFILYDYVLGKDNDLKEIIEDAVYLDVKFKFIVMVKKGYVEIVDIL